MRQPKSKRRDDKPKAFGTITLSAMIHVALLVALTFMTNSHKKTEALGVDQGIANAGTQDTPVIMDLAPSAGSEAEASASKPLLADAKDVNAVELPADKNDIATKPVEKAAPKPAAKIAVVKAAAVVARADGDVEVKAALKKARAEEVAKNEEETVAAPATIKEMPEDPAPPQEQSSDDQAAAAATTVAAAETAPVPAAAPAPAPEATPAPIAAAKPAPVVAQDTTSGTTTAPAKTEGTSQAPTKSTTAGAGQEATPTKSTSPTSGNGTALAAGAGSAAGAPSGSPTGAAINADLLREQSGPRPAYPDQDRLLNRSGTVVIRATVLSDGSVTNVRLAQSSGSALMDSSAVTTYSRWKYFPGQAGEVVKRFNFQLDGNAKTRYAKLRHQ